MHPESLAMICERAGMGKENAEGVPKCYSGAHRPCESMWS